jgi:hypothetical protein
LRTNALPLAPRRARSAGAGMNSFGVGSKFTPLQKCAGANKSAKPTQPPKWQKGDGRVQPPKWQPGSSLPGERDRSNRARRPNGWLAGRPGSGARRTPARPWPFAGALAQGLTAAGLGAYIWWTYNLVRILSRVAEGRARRRHSNRFAIAANAGANSRPACQRRIRNRRMPIRAARVTPMGQIRWSTASGHSAGAVNPPYHSHPPGLEPKTLDRNQGAPGRHLGDVRPQERGPSRGVRDRFREGTTSRVGPARPRRVFGGRTGRPLALI